MATRRMFLKGIGATSTGARTTLHAAPALIAAIAGRAAAATWKSPEEAATDEAFWTSVAQAFRTDGRYLMLNGGGSNPPPHQVVDALTTFEAFAAAAPRPNNAQLVARMDQHRQRLARLLGCDAEEVAITRNTTEGLNIVANGIDMNAGDEVVLTSFDRTYGAVPLRLRAARQGIVLREVSLSTPPSDDEVVSKVSAALSPRTRLILCSHVADGWGFVLPIARLSAIARERGIPLLADGALSFGHLAFDVRQLGCDYFVTSLHKWLSAPLGTGLMYVRRDRIAPLWPLYGARDPQSADIRKFEQIGTRSGATIAAIGQALDFHEAVGAERKAARLRYLGTYLLDRLKGDARVRCITDPNEARRGSLMRIGIVGLKGPQLETALRERFGIFTFGGFNDGFEGIYASPSLFNLPVHLVRFIEALRAIANSE